MDFTQIQVGLDIATAASIIGASIAFIYSNLRESRKLRNERRNILAMEKTADLVMFLSDKSVEAASINNEINCTLNEYNDALLIHLAKRTDVLTYVPEEVSIRPLISKLEENIFIPIKLKLDLYPYRKFLSNEIEKDIDKLLEFINSYVNIDGVSFYETVCDIIRTPETIAHFVFFLEEKEVITINVEAPLLNDNSYLKSIMNEFDTLDELDKIDLRYAFFKKVKLENIENKKLWQDIPKKIQASVRAMIEKTVE